MDSASIPMHAERAYLFRHSLLRDAAYQLQLPGTREALHELASRLLEELFIPLGELAADSVAIEIAEHVSRARSGRPQADLLDRERAWTRRAAAHADRSYQAAVAAGLWGKLAELNTGATRVEDLRNSAVSFARAGAPREAARQFGASLEAAEALGDDEARLLALHGLAVFMRNTGKLEVAEQLSRQALELAERLHNGPVRSNLMENLATICGVVGRREEAMRLMQAAVAGASEEDRGRYEQSFATLCWQSGNFAEARRRFNDALSLLRRHPDRRNEGVALSNLGGLLHSEEKFDEAEKTYREALEIAREVGDVRSEGIVLGNLGILNLAQGRLLDADELLRRSIEICREVSNRLFEGVALGSQAIVLLKLGRKVEARAGLEDALAMHRAVGNSRFEGGQLCDFALQLLLQGMHDEARSTWLRGELILRQHDSPANLEVTRRQMFDACTEAGVAPFEVRAGRR